MSAGGARDDEDAAGGRGGNDESAGERVLVLVEHVPPGAHAILRDGRAQVPPRRVKRCQERARPIATRKTYGPPVVIAAAAATPSRRRSKPRVSRDVRVHAIAAATIPAASPAATTAGAVISAVPTNAPAATAPERERPLTSRPAPVRTNPTARDHEGSPSPVSASRRLTTTAMPAVIKAARPGPSRRTSSA